MLSLTTMCGLVGCASMQAEETTYICPNAPANATVCTQRVCKVNVVVSGNTVDVKPYPDIYMCGKKANKVNVVWLLPDNYSFRAGDGVFIWKGNKGDGPEDPANYKNDLSDNTATSDDDGDNPSTGGSRYRWHAQNGLFGYKHSYRIFFHSNDGTALIYDPTIAYGK